MRANLATADLRLLRVFATVVECGGFSAAQVALNVGQSTISTQMAALEARIGLKLCRRGRAGFALTDDGRAVYRATQRLFRALDTFAAEVGSIGGRLAGELHIGAIDNLISNPDFHLAEALARFSRRGGAVHLTLHVDSPLELERAVLDGRYHLGIGTFPNHAPGLDYTPVFEETMALYCGRDHPFFARDDAAIGRHEIDAAPYVRRGYATARAGGRLPRNATATADNMEAIALMVLSGRFIGHLPVHYARRWVDTGAMRPLLDARYRFASPFDIVVRKGIAATAVIEAFTADLAAAFGTADRMAGGRGSGAS